MSDTEAFDTLFDDKARAAHAAGPVGYDERKACARQYACF